MYRRLFIIIFLILCLIPLVKAYDDAAYVPVNAKDGYITDGGVCGRWDDNTSTYGILGVDGVSQCITDSVSDNSRLYFSFNLSEYDSCTISDASLYFYIHSISKYPTKWGAWSGIYDPRANTSFAFNQIGDYVDVTDWNCCGAEDYTSNHIQYWTVGWKIITLDINDLSTTQNTDIEIRPNQDWYDYMDGAGRRYQFNVRMTEYPGYLYDPFLYIVYSGCDTDICNSGWQGGGNWLIDGYYQGDVVCEDVNHDFSGQNITIFGEGSLSLINSNITIDISRSFLDWSSNSFFDWDGVSIFV